MSRLGLTYSCGNQSEEKQAPPPEQTEKSEKTEEVHHSETSVVVLDNGKRWEANPETTTGVKNMEKILNSFTEKDNVKAYAKLADSLKTEFSMIFQKCTMTGEAHNQLHNYLLPVRDLLETLQSTDLKQCQESYNKLSEQFKRI